MVRSVDCNRSKRRGRPTRGPRLPQQDRCERVSYPPNHRPRKGKGQHSQRTRRKRHRRRRKCRNVKRRRRRGQKRVRNMMGVGVRILQVTCKHARATRVNDRHLRCSGRHRLFLADRFQRNRRKGERGNRRHRVINRPRASGGANGSRSHHRLTRHSRSRRRAHRRNHGSATFPRTTSSSRRTRRGDRCKCVSVPSVE